MCAYDKITLMTTEPIYKEIGKIIRALRRRADKAQNVLAAQLGISRATLANIETGRQRILVHQLYAFADVLGVKLADLLPVSRGEPVEASLAALSIEGDLNAEQRKQVMSLIGSVANKESASQKAKERHVETTKRNSGRTGANPAR